MKQERRAEKSERKKARYRNVGRKFFDGKNVKEVLAKLEAAFSFGASDLEACLYADISEDSLYRYEQRNPTFRERKQRLKEKPVLKARQSVVNSLDVDAHLAFKFLKAKRSKEFSERVEVDHSGEIRGFSVKITTVKKKNDETNILGTNNKAK